MLFKVILLLSLAGFLIQIQAKRNFNLEFHKLSCKSYTPIMKQGSCDYKKLAIGRYAFNAMLELQSPLDPAAMIFIAIDYRMPPAITSQSFFKLKTKLCDLLKGIRTVPIVKNVIKDVLKNSNFPTSCPICANVMYNMSNMVVTSEILPEFVPSAGFNLSLNFFNKEALIVDWKLEGSIVKKT